MPMNIAGVTAQRLFWISIWLQAMNRILQLSPPGKLSHLLYP